MVAKWSQRALPEGEVNLIAFGDYGNGKPSQKETATARLELVRRISLDAVLPWRTSTATEQVDDADTPDDDEPPRRSAAE